MITRLLHPSRPAGSLCLLVAGMALGAGLASAADAPKAAASLIRSARSGPWSDPTTWEGGKLPAAGGRVQVRTGHAVTYDLDSNLVYRLVHVAGTLTFAPDRATTMNVGLLRVQAGDEVTEDGFECDAHVAPIDPRIPRPWLAVGTPEKPIAAGRQAHIRLHYIEGMDRETCPAIVCCGGRMDFHGAPLSRTWVKLGANVRKGDATVTLSEVATGWRVGDRVLITGTSSSLGSLLGTRRPGVKGTERWPLATEERTIQKIEGTQVTLNEPLLQDHLGDGPYRGEVANLSRNVIVESADPAQPRGHTMYHRDSAGAISYAEFRHLGKEGVLGKYPIHFHLVGESMRGSYVIGASVWDSGNRWITIHGTNYLVVRDCVGYRSIGHGYFLEDGTEIYNVLDRNLAVQAFRGKPLPKQVLPFDQNEGAGFWWANSLNTFTRNVAVENDRYGYRFEATPTSRLKLTFPIQQPDGTRKPTDIRTLPFVRFEDNECHGDGLYGCNLGEGVSRVGPDEKHPFIVRNLKIWNTHYGFRPQVPSLLVENLHIWRAAYGVYHPNYDNHVYRNVYIGQTNTEPFNRGHDDNSVQHGTLVVDGITFDGIRSGDSMPLIQISDDNPSGNATSHFRKVTLNNWTGSKNRALVNLGGGPRPDPSTEKGVPVYLHDWFGAGRHAKVVSIKAGELKADGLTYREEPLLTGDESRVAEISDVRFPDPLQPVDDLPPSTVITHVQRTSVGLRVRGVSADNGAIREVIVNGQKARALDGNFVQWEVTLQGTPSQVEAQSTDAAGNVEVRPHRVAVTP